MKIMIQMLITVLLPFYLGSCKPEPVVGPSSPPTSAIIWKYERDFKSLASNNYIYDGMLVQGTSSDDGQFKLLALTLDSGKLIWELGGFPNYFDPYDPEYTFISGNMLVLSGSSYTRVVNLETGQTLWEDNLIEGYFNVCIIDDYVYKATETFEKSELYRYNLFTGQKEFLFAITTSEHGDGKFRPSLCMPVSWTDSLGNELLVLATRSWSGNSYRMDIMAWNLTADSMSWYRKGIDERASSSRPAIEDNRVYFFSISSVYCIDAANGSTIWSFDRDPADNFSGFKTANILLVKDKVIAKSDSYWMYGLDKLTGKRLWANSNTAPMPYLLREHKDIIWFSSGGVHAIDANTGQTLLNGWDNNGKGSFWSNAVVHHPTLDYIYTTDGDFIYCLDQNKMK